MNSDTEYVFEIQPVLDVVLNKPQSSDIDGNGYQKRIFNWKDR